MLTELSIKNFAIIDDLRIRFSGGLTILSGETGAGKSIIINAVNLLLGSRASAALIRTGAQTAEIEALFQVSAGSLAAEAMRQQGLDDAEGLVARRCISRNDRHRIYVNGRLSTMQALKEITQHLASISGQHAHQGLLKEDRQLYILDRFGGLLPLREQVREAYQQILPLLKELKRLYTLQKNRSDQIELLRFQKSEILAARMTPGEDARLEQEAARLKHAEKLYQTVRESLETLYSARGAVVEQLTGVKKDLAALSGIDAVLSAPAENISEITYRVEDIVEELRSYLSTIQMDERRLAEVEDRLNLLNQLKRKYGKSIENVLERADRIQQELDAIGNLEGRIAETEAALGKKHAQAARFCRQLSKERRLAADIVAEKVEKELTTLKMPDTQFRIKLANTPADKTLDPHLQAGGNAMSETGFERISFFITPNVGESLKSLSDIASGGELSRVVLALKAILARKDSVETVVFDEVDAGIGGGVAEVVGKKLFDFSSLHQVICITHLPQIAKFGHTHFMISKRVKSGRTTTVIERLDEKKRIQEIARMLGGQKITHKTLAHARELLRKTSS